MGAAHSNDLRIRVVAEVAAGRMSRRQAAAHFRVSAASAVRWVELKEETGGISPRPRGGKSRSPLEPHSAWLLDLTAREGDLTVAEIGRRILEGLSLSTTEASIRRFFIRHKISFKKKRCTPPSKHDQTWPRRGGSGRPTRPSSIPKSSSSSMRRGPTPRWSEPMAVLAGATG